MSMGTSVSKLMAFLADALLKIVVNFRLVGTLIRFMCDRISKLGKIQALISCLN